MMHQPLVILCGPTASGKTRLAIDVAKALNGEIISADSMQIYREMNIGTAKPSAEEMQGIRHHMIDCAEIGGEFNAAIYQQQARQHIAEIAERGRLPVLCGGTGLFMSAVVYGLDFSGADIDKQYREQLNTLAGEQGNQALHDLLAVQDPAAAERIHPNNVKRVIRALEIARNGGNDSCEPSPLFNGQPLYHTAWLGLTMDRATLYRRIDARVDAMIASGLADEVKRLAGQFDRECIAFQGLGYKELLCYLDGEYSLNEALEKIKQGTRNYAKRQMTWFKREKSIKWLDMENYPSYLELLEDALGYIKAQLHIG